MAIREEFDYLLIYDREKGRPRLSLRAGVRGGRLLPMIVKVTGRPVREGHNDMFKALLKCGGLKLVEKEPQGERYGIRADLAPIAGAFILLLRRSTNPSKWGKLFHEALEGSRPFIGEALAEFFIMALNLSSSMRKTPRRKGLPQAVLPQAADAVSAAMRGFVEAIRRDTKWKEGS